MIKKHCDKCGTECKARHIIIEDTRDSQTNESMKMKEVGLCWPCMRTYQIEKNNGKTNFETLWNSVQKSKESSPNQGELT